MSERAAADAIIVGAGLSGLVCATRLVDAGKSVLVLEARDRVGGRLHSAMLAGTTIDLGGQWMAVGQPRLAALAASLEVPTFPQRRDGHALFGLPDRPWLTRVAIALAQWRAARRIQRFAQHPPATADASSLAGWLVQTIKRPSARALIAMHAELVFAIDPADLSLLHYLRTFATTGGWGHAGPDLPGGCREHRFDGGAQALALALTSKLPASTLRLSAPVRAIAQTPDSVTVAIDSTTFTAAHVVLALPPALARSIDVALPDAARRTIDASRLGAVVKCFAAYDRPFWRDAGLSGEGYRPDGDVRATVALEPPPARAGPSILLAFIVGPIATDWHTRATDARRASVLAALVEQFGAAAAAPLDYTEVDWSTDPWSTGCVASLPPNVLSAGATWREPHGRIHIAGTESATIWPGYMEGAIEAGERAAAEILAHGSSVALRA